ncbi:MAG: nucleotidyltransferase [Deltaproteobacteria bacterium]|nr:nucleotidyltransferase [Deltaproteobacteria bacterium]MBW2152356.1 nucleotidyltransferase [Deltaproteobacteria bacterium]
MLNEDYKDMLRALSDEKVKFLLIGAYAMAAHGYPRATMDIDIWVMPSPENADAVVRALRRFGAPLHNLAKEDLQKDGTIFQIGVAPRRIDLITAVSGLQFEEVYRRSLSVNIEGIEVHIPSIDDMILNKRASGRTKDLADAEALESLKNSDRDRDVHH